MDIATASTNAATVKTPEEADSEAPTRIPPLKPLSFTNGVLKHRHPHNPAPLLVSYRECLKNHAATMGGHAVDGCGEFMPSPTCNPSDPSSLKCAACGCHRNFHRRDPEDPPPSTAAVQHVIEYQPHHRHHPPPPLPAPPRSPNSASPPPISSSYYPSATHVLLALSSCGLPGQPHENHMPTGGGSGGNPNPTSRKRPRTKFTQNQKDRMYEFAEKLAWKMQKRDDDAISDFCNQIGVEKAVFKVWMHNNKNTLRKKDSMIHEPNGDAITHRINLDNSGDQLNPTHNHHHHHHSIGRSDELTAHPVATNGSSSSS